jgi:putative DNA primase/helicase
MLVIQGDQYLGKTKWFKSLVPEELGLCKDGMLLRPDNKDSVKQVCSFWLVELGELDSTFKKSDIAQLKAFITNKSDVLRRAFARKESHYARRTVFFGSVNPKQFLNDPTGNRRFWTIEAAEINHTHNLDMQQIWSEVLHHWRNGESYFLTSAELDLLNAHNEQFTSVDPIVERISSHLEWSDPETLWSWNTATDILISIGIERPTKAEQNVAADAIRKMNGGKCKRTNASRLLLAPKVAIRG